MANLRSGTYGNYYGSFFNESEPLSQSEMETNATYFYSAMKLKGWSDNSIAAMLGNMQAESSINPGRWQSDDVGNYNLGYGLVQWTPVTKYTDWCSLNGQPDPSVMDSNISRIIYEVENGLQWITTQSYPISFLEFTVSNDSVMNLAAAFLINYERPADQSDAVKQYRGSLAESWYTYITGQTPTPQTPTRARKKYNFLLFKKKERIIKR